MGTIVKNLKSHECLGFQVKERCHAGEKHFRGKVKDSSDGASETS